MLYSLLSTLYHPHAVYHNVYKMIICFRNRHDIPKMSNALFVDSRNEGSRVLQVPAVAVYGYESSVATACDSAHSNTDAMSPPWQPLLLFLLSRNCCSDMDFNWPMPSC